MPCCYTRDVPTGSKRHFFMAVASVILAAVALVAIALPVSNAMRQHQQVAAAAASSAVAAAVNDTSGVSRGSSGSGSLSPEAAAALQPVPAGTQACNGVPGLCSVPVRLVSFPGTHNSNSIKNREFIAETQLLSFREQLQAGARLFDIDYAGAQFGTRFGHCFSCFCSFAANAEDSDPVQVFATMADFLKQHPGDVIVIGLSNINCGDKAAARQQLLQVLADSPLAQYLATTVVGANTTLGELVDSNQRAVMLFYDQWISASGHMVGSQHVPEQPLWRAYGGDTTVDANGEAAIDAQVANMLTADFGKQIKSAPPSIDKPWRVVGLFASTCLSCRNTAQCGAVSCAIKTNSEPFVLYLLGKLTTEWLINQGQHVLVPAFNGYQVDYFGTAIGNRGLAQATERLNQGFAWMYTMRPKDALTQGLGNCAWVLDDSAFAGGLVCVHHGQQRIDTLLSPAITNSSSSSGSSTGSGNTSSDGIFRLLGRKLTEAAAATAVTTADAVTAGTATSAAGRSSRWILLPGNGNLQLQLFKDAQLIRQVVGTAGKLTWVDLGYSYEALQVVWPSRTSR